MADQRTIFAAELFKRALDHPPEGRAAFLDHACRNDLEVRREVELLLKYNDDRDDFLAELDIEVALKSFPSGELKTNKHIGAYNVLSHLGSGGMRDVYVADDEKLNRRLALKLVGFGIGGEETARHFRREAQILASLN